MELWVDMWAVTYSFAYLVFLLMTNVSVWLFNCGNYFVNFNFVDLIRSGRPAQLVFLYITFEAVTGVSLKIFYFNLVRYTYKYIQVTECKRYSM